MQYSSPRGSYDTTSRSTRSPLSLTTHSATSCGTKMLLEESPSGQSSSAPSPLTSSHAQPSSCRCLSTSWRSGGRISYLLQLCDQSIG
jgi:hypothetical protein